MASSAAAKRTAQTRVVVVMAVLLAIIVFLTFTKPRLSQRSEAQRVASAQQSILKTEQARAGTYSPGSENVTKILANAALLDGIVQYLPGESAEADLLLNVKGLVSTAADAIGLQSMNIGEPTPGTVTTPGVGLVSIQIACLAASGQISQFTSSLSNSSKLLTTVSGITVSPGTPEKAVGDTTPPSDQAPVIVDVIDAPLLNWVFTLNIWYAKEPGVASRAAPVTTPATTIPVTTP